MATEEYTECGTSIDGHISPPKPTNSLCELAQMAKRGEVKFKELLLNTFEGIPVRVDDSLQGLQYYISVSPELKELLWKKYGSKTA